MPEAGGAEPPSANTLTYHARVQAYLQHTQPKLLSHPPTIGPKAKPPDEPILAKPVTVNMVTPIDNMVHPPSLYHLNKMRSTKTAHRGTVESIHRSMSHPRSSLDRKGKLPIRSAALPTATKFGMSPILLIHRDDSSTQHTSDPWLRQIINEMCVNLSSCIDNINIIHEQYYTMFKKMAAVSTFVGVKVFQWLL